MAIQELDHKPDVMAHFPDHSGYRWLKMHDAEKKYGFAAFTERGDALELHVTLTRWGSQVRRSIHNDLKWLKKEAKRLGKKRITGVRVNGKEIYDPRLFKFARSFGFTETCIIQTASIALD